MDTLYQCSDEDARRRQTFRESPCNGVDDVRVDGTRLSVLCLRPVPGDATVTVTPADGRAGRAVTVTGAAPASPGAAVLDVRVEAPGDAGPYRLSVAHEGFDPALASATFSFALDCDGDTDCATGGTCVPPRVAEPVLDYLGRDYAGLRQALFDRLSVIAPAWADRNPADAGVLLVELFAYLGDLLAAAQDAVSAEAYLGTARRRVSVARHARMLDYRMHQGAAARCWLVLTVDEDVSAAFAQRAACVPGPALVPEGHQVRSADGGSIFHTLAPITPTAARNAIDLYTWGQNRCCLPAGATAATLTGHIGLRPGEILLLEEVRGKTVADPPDVTHRRPVRLTEVTASHDPVTGTDVTEVRWATEDALPFPLWAGRFPPISRR